MTEIQFIEDLLQVVLGKYGHTFILRDADIPLLNSFDRQIQKGVSLTDRQFNLLKLKLEIYTSQFKNQNIKSWEAALQNSAYEFREIDRTKSISIVSKDDVVANNRSHLSLKDGDYIKVRFPFNKKYISKLDKIIGSNTTKTYFHEKNSHEHYFRLSAMNCYRIHNTFPEWQTDEKIKELSKEVNNVLENKENYIPIYKENKFINIDEKIINKINSDDNLKIADSSIAFGYYIEECNNKTLLETIAYRKQPTVLVHTDEHTVFDIMNCIDFLDRYPILVCVDKDDCYNQVKEIHTAISKFIPNNLHSVLFRVESSDKENAGLNLFVKENNLNNWVDNTTKVVYIKKDKLPKVLLKSDFKPRTALCKSSLRSNRLVTNYVSYNCDLIVYNDTSLSSFSKYSNKGFNSWQVVN